MRWFFLSPLDTLFFRDGKPFDIGVESFADFIFPPSPRTFYGALRTYIIFSHSDFNKYKADNNIYEVVGDENTLGSLKIYGPILAKKIDSHINIYFPIPKDIMIDNKSKKTVFLKPKKEEKIKSNIDVNIDFVIPEELEDLEEIEGYFDLDDMKSYLEEDVNTLNLRVQNRELFYKIENRVGIKLDKKRGTVEPHYLYNVPHIRFGRFNDFYGYGFLIGVENDESLIKSNGEFRLGGETRIVRFEEIENEAIQDIVNRLKSKVLNRKNSNRIKFILFTPGIFENGWYPDFLKKNSSNELIGEIGNLKVKLVGCILDKPKYLGGFNLVQKIPKKMKKVVPAGSVYFFEVLNGDVNDFINKYFFKSILENDLSKEGFGQIMIGGW